MKPIHTVEKVDLDRFMGDWYVIASIPTFIEKDAFNAIESYQLDDDRTVATTFKFYIIPYGLDTMALESGVTNINRGRKNE